MLKEKSNLKTFLADLEKLRKKVVVVGVPENKATRKGDKINNATLAYIHEKGSPAAHIPARPFLKPGIALVKDQCADALAKTAETLGTGNIDLSGMKEAALIAETSVKKFIATGQVKPALSKKYKKSLMRHMLKRVSKKKRPAEKERIKNEGFTPLYRTGQAGLAGSIKGLVRDKD